MFKLGDAVIQTTSSTQNIEDGFVTFVSESGRVVVTSRGTRYECHDNFQTWVRRGSSATLALAK